MGSIDKIINYRYKTHGADSLIGKMQKLLITLGAAALAYRAIRAAADFVTDSIREGSNAIEEYNKFLVVFGDNAREIDTRLKAFADTTNRSHIELRGLAATVQDMLVPMGVLRSEASAMSAKFVEVAVDLSSFNDVPVTETLLAMKAGLAGLSRPLRRFGVDVRMPTQNAELLAMGIEGGYNAATTAEKALAVLNLTMRHSADAMGDAVRTADDFANAMRGLEADVKELKVEVGQALIESLDKLLPRLSGFINEIGPDLVDVAGDLGAVFVDITLGALDLIETFGGLKATLQIITAAVVSLTVVLIAQKVALSGLGVFYGGFSDKIIKVTTALKGLKIQSLLTSKTLGLAGLGAAAVFTTTQLIKLVNVINETDAALEAAEEANRTAEIQARVLHIKNVELARQLETGNIPALIRMREELENQTLVGNTAMSGLDEINSRLNILTDESYNAAIAQLELAKSMLALDIFGASLTTGLEKQIAMLIEARDAVHGVTAELEPVVAGLGGGGTPAEPPFVKAAYEFTRIMRQERQEMVQARMLEAEALAKRHLIFQETNLAEMDRTHQLNDLRNQGAYEFGRILSSGGKDWEAQMLSALIRMGTEFAKMQFAKSLGAFGGPIFGFLGGLV